MNDNSTPNLRKRGLGRGFDSLIPTQIVEDEFDVQAERTATGERRSADRLVELDNSLIDPNPHQPRQFFAEGPLLEMADSIRVHGILQPLVVTRKGDRYELIAGERRLRASKLAGLSTVPAIVRSYDEQQKLELALIENLQRADLNPIETATAYRKLIDQFNMTGEELGRRVGRDSSTVSNTMRLLNLPKAAKRAVAEAVISEGHGRVLLTLEEPEKQQELLDLIIGSRWSVRQAEEFARGFRGRRGSKDRAIKRITKTNELTSSLGDYLGTKVTQVTTAKGGKLLIEYTTEAELKRIYRAIRKES